MLFMETLRKLGHRGLNAQCHMAACHSDDTRTWGFRHLGTLAWALWTLPLGVEGKRKKELSLESGPDLPGSPWFSTSHTLVLPAPESAQRQRSPQLAFILLSFFWPCYGACRILVPQRGIEPMSPALEAWNLNPWTIWEV